MNSERMDHVKFASRAFSDMGSGRGAELIALSQEHPEDIIIEQLRQTFFFGSRNGDDPVDDCEVRRIPLDVEIAERDPGKDDLHEPLNVRWCGAIALVADGVRERLIRRLALADGVRERLR